MTSAMKLSTPVVLLGLTLASCLARAADPKPVTYDDDVKPVLREHCFKCHGDDDGKSGLNMQSYATLLKGGSGGVVVEAGRPGTSVLYQALAHEGDAVPMPPKRPRIADAQVALVRVWIEQGLRESASSTSSAVKRRSLEFRPSVADASSGPGAMPEGLPDAHLPIPRRPHPVTALAASPRAPLLAVAGNERILLYQTETHALVGTLPFPEGVPFVLKFSRDGRVLLAAGGRPVQSGKAILFDVKTGRRLAEIGDEVDSVLAADLSPDQQWLALGGPGKVVKVFATRDGHLAYKIEKHTDWITAIAFSPDGQRLASADRTGAVHLWESKAGGILLSLSEHKDSVGALSWRSDGEMLATGSEDGKLILWDAQAGWPAATLDAPHRLMPATGVYGKLAGGVLAVQFTADGRLLTTGRDRVVRFWDSSGQALASFESRAALPLKVAAGFDGKSLIAGDSAGELHFWGTPDRQVK